MAKLSLQRFFVFVHIDNPGMQFLIDQLDLSDITP